MDFEIQYLVTQAQHALEESSRHKVTTPAHLEAIGAAKWFLSRAQELASTRRAAA